MGRRVRSEIWRKRRRVLTSARQLIRLPTLGISRSGRQVRRHGFLAPEDREAQFLRFRRVAAGLPIFGEVLQLRVSCGPKSSATGSSRSTTLAECSTGCGPARGGLYKAKCSAEILEWS